ncbi:MAG: IS5/IS1182 family transposase, partial [Synergistaceae bacterium]|nr:IS5/IS1182 family transposase [Synergistaceae bacterium]
LISQLRFVIERVNGILKRFRILSSKYRNAPQTFIKTFSLICGVYNFQCLM